MIVKCYISMNGFYKITESLNEVLKDNGFNVVTLGDTYQLDIVRQTIFPYAHIVPDSSLKQGQITEWTFKVIGMDLVDFNKNNIRNKTTPFYGTDNLQDILNDIHNRLSQFVEQYERGVQSGLLMKIQDAVSFTSFLQRGENLLAGWEIDFTITAPTEGSIC